MRPTVERTPKFPFVSPWRRVYALSMRTGHNHPRRGDAPYPDQNARSEPQRPAGADTARRPCTLTAGGGRCRIRTGSWSPEGPQPFPLETTARAPVYGVARQVNDSQPGQRPAAADARGLIGLEPTSTVKDRPDHRSRHKPRASEFTPCPDEACAAPNRRPRRRAHPATFAPAPPPRNCFSRRPAERGTRARQGVNW